MNLLPFEDIEIESPLSKSEVEKAVLGAISLNPVLGMAFNKDSFKDYEGVVGDGAFKVRRTLKSGTNSFIPIVSGTIQENRNEGSRIGLKIRLSKFVYIFLVIMTLFSLSLTVIPLFNKTTENQAMTELLEDDILKEHLSQEDHQEIKSLGQNNGLNFENVFFLIVPYLLCILFFNIETEKVKVKLKEVLNAR